MRDPDRDPVANERSPLRGALRWVVAVPIAVFVVGSLFFVMASLVDGTWLVEALMRVFPLKERELTPEERCEMERLQGAPAITIEGNVGYLDKRSFVPLPDAEIRGEQGLAAIRDVEVDAEGRFRLVTALPFVPSPECADQTPGRTAAAPRLFFQAPGCRERRVPVTAAWVPRRIVLVCPDRV